MKLTAVAIAALSAAITFAGQNAAFITKPDKAKLVPEKAVSSLTLRPENHDKTVFYRITMQVKLKQPDDMVFRITCNGKNREWERVRTENTGWQKICRYIAPGEEWSCTYNVKTRGNTFFVRNIKLEKLDENDLTANLLPPLENAGWHNAWGKKQAANRFEKSDESPFGEYVFTSEINKGTCYPAILSVPAVPGRTLLIEVWVKGEPDEIWLATLSNRGSKIFPVKKEWSRQEIRIKVKDNSVPAAAKIVFWKPKTDKALKITFGQVKASYEK